MGSHNSLSPWGEGQGEGAGREVERMRRDITGLARRLRREQTDAEKKLWSRIRNRQINGWKFNRQVPSGPYVLDFFCFEASLAIEVDGSQHADERVEHDRKRTAYLDQQGILVLRFWNADVLNNIDGVMQRIYLTLGQRPAPSPGALKRQRSSSEGEQARRPLPKGRGEGVNEVGGATIPSPLGEKVRVRGRAARANERRRLVDNT